MGNAIQYNPNGSMDGKGARTGAMFFDPDTGDAIDMSQVMPGIASSVTGPAPVVAPVRQAVQTPPKVCKPETFNVISLAKKRLRFLKAEVKKLRVLEKEQVQLEKLLAASEKPLAVVRDISNKRNAK